MRLALSRSRGCGSRERISAVRAKATTGFISGKQATSGWRVKPVARRAGAPISSALQMVGVSKARRASRAWRSGRLGIRFSPAGQGFAPALGATPSGRKGFSAGPISRIIKSRRSGGRPMSYTVSHFEIRARDQAAMEKFYTEVMGFIVSDRGVLDRGPMKGRELIFLSHSPEEHHQIVLIPSDATGPGSGIGHVAFRVDSLDEVRRVYEKVRVLPHAKPEPVSHANTWSVYFRDPEDNRIEIFTQTPWHATQPCRFDVDYDLDDKKLKETTLADARTLSGFTTGEEWQQNFDSQFEKS